MSLVVSTRPPGVSSVTMRTTAPSSRAFSIPRSRNRPVAGEDSLVHLEHGSVWTGSYRSRDPLRQHGSAEPRQHQNEA